MYAELKSLVSPDINLLNYCPEEEDNFGFYIEASIGPLGEASGDIFGFQVCSPNWIFTNFTSENAIFGKNFLILKNYDFEEIRSKLTDLCARTSGEDWQEIAKKLAQFGSWEFDNYC